MPKSSRAIRTPRDLRSFKVAAASETFSITALSVTSNSKLAGSKAVVFSIATILSRSWLSESWQADKFTEIRNLENPKSIHLAA